MKNKNENILIMPHFYADFLKDLAAQSVKIDEFNANINGDILDKTIKDPYIEHINIIDKLNEIARAAEHKQEQQRLSLAEYAQILLIIDTLINKLQDVEEAETTI